jgi:hypothetical protein
VPLPVSRVFKAEEVRLTRSVDVPPDGPAHDCSICLSINFARAPSPRRNQSDSAIVNYENFLTTPSFERMDYPMFLHFTETAKRGT